MKDISDKKLAIILIIIIILLILLFYLLFNIYVKDFCFWPWCRYVGCNPNYENCFWP